MTRPQRPSDRATPPRPRREPAIVPLLALVVLVASRLAGRVARLGRALASAATTVGRAVGRHATVATRRVVRRVAADGPVLIRRFGGWLRHGLAPRVALGAGVATALVVAGLERAVQAGDQLATWAGIHAHRLVEGARDVAGIALLVGAPAVWRWVRPRLAAAGGVMGGGARVGWRQVRTRGPGVARVGALAGGITVTTGVVAALLALPTLHAAAGLVDVTDADGSLPALEERSEVLAADGSVLATWQTEVDRRVVPLDALPDHVGQAVVSAEDHRFTEHGGYDVVGLARAAWANVRAGRAVQGGSTITQQVAKQSFVGDAPTLARKARELVYAVALEREHDKAALLERYLNQVYFGAGAYGVAAAAEELFATAPEHLSVDQSALLAGLIRSPGALDPRAEPDEAMRRRDAVLARMAELGHLSADEARAAAAEPTELAEPRERSPREPHAVAAVMRELRGAEALGDDPDEREHTLRTGGLEIHTTIEPALQNHIDEVVAAHLPGDGRAAAVAAVDPRSGAVRALHGGADFAASQFDLATQARRQPGSAVKPFVAAAALEAGHDPAAALEGDAVATFDTAGEDWRVRNHGGADYGSVDLAAALRGSVNTAFADLATTYGSEGIADVLARVGVDVDAALGAADARGPAIALGGMTHGVSPLELASAYAPFAADGRHHQPHLVTRVVDRDGNELLAADEEGRAALDADVARRVGGMLREVVRSGTGTAAAVDGADVLGKTGTSQDSADAWFVGGNESLMAAVWVGDPEERRTMGHATGGTVAAPLWADAIGPSLAD